MNIRVVFGCRGTSAVISTPLVALFLAAATQLAWGQSITGAIVGSVRDPTNLPVAGAEVTLVRAATGDKRQSTTNERGYFVVSSLQRGEYHLSVTSPGFKTIERTSIMLTAAETLSVGDLVLEVGTVSDKVTVTAERTVVQTASAERSGVVTSAQLGHLLIQGRNVMSLVQLLPGVVDTAPAEGPASTWRLNVLGGRENQNAVSIDGMNVNENGNGRNFLVQVSMDALVEVKVLISNYQAEYGRMSGANINLVTKSGSREFHGTAGYYKRHEQFNANSFFNNRLGVPKPRYRYNTWVYNIGGPAYIPGKLNRNRDKLFFFWNQEYWPTKGPGGISQLTLPTELERTGDFSQSVDLNRRLISVIDPANGQPFLGNRVPATRVDRNGQALLKYFPAPNFSDQAVSAGLYNYVFQDQTSNEFREDTLRLDYNFDARNRLFGTYSAHHTSATSSLSPWPQTRNTYKKDGRLFVGQYQHVFSPTLLHELHLGWAEYVEADRPSAEALRNNARDQVAFNLGQFYPGANPLKIIPNATFGGVTNGANINTSSWFPIHGGPRQFSVSNTVSKIVRSHGLKAGIYVERSFRDTPDFGSSLLWMGRFDFRNNVNNPLNTGYAYSNAALGVFDSYSESSADVFTHFAANDVEWYIQDNWKVAPRLTLDYGVRFMWLQPFAERDRALSSFSFARFDPRRTVSLIQPALAGNRRIGVDRATGQTYPEIAIGAVAPGTGDPLNGITRPTKELGFERGSLVNDPGVRLAPRFGFAYDPFGKGRTAVRGGFGIFYNRQSIHQEQALGYIAQAPMVSTPVVYYGAMSALPSSSGLLFPQNILGIDQAGGLPTVMNFSLGVQQNVGFGTVLDVGYVGSVGRHLLWTRNLNSIPFGANFARENLDPTTQRVLPQAFLRPVTGYNNITQREYASSSNYHSLQVTANRRFARGIQFGAAWTWSKAMDYGSRDGAAISMLVPIRVWNYGLADFDMTHLFKVNWLWDVPNVPWQSPVARHLLDNWQVSGIASFLSGQPLGIGFTTTTGLDITGSPTDGPRVVVTGNPVLPKSERTFDRNFRTDVFRLPAQGTIGNSARSVIRGPGVNNWDIAVFKNFPIREPVSLQFRCELYNAFNHTQFSGLNTTARFDPAGNQLNAQLGAFTSARNPRQMQLALRFYF